MQWGDAGSRRGRGEVARSNKASSNAKVITSNVGPHGVLPEKSFVIIRYV